MAFWLAFTLAAAATAAPSASPAPVHHVLHADTNVWDVTAQDMNNDGVKDIFAVCCDPKSDPQRKFVAVYLADASGAYPARPSFRINLDPAVSTLFFAEVDGASPMELVAAHASGATVYQFKDNAMGPLSTCEFASIFPVGSEEPIFLKKTAQDLTGDGKDEWLIPTPAGYDIRNADGSIAKVNCHVVSEIRPGSTLYIMHRLPACHVFELEGQSQKSLAFLSDKYADFAYGDAWREQKRFRIPLNLDQKWEAASRMDDINLDGLPDLVVTQTKGSVNLQVLTQIYLASAPFTYNEKPSMTFETKGDIASPELKDVDGDKDLDLVFVRIPFGVTTFVNYFVRRKVSARVDVHLFDGKTFPEDPTFESKFTLDAPEGREQVAYTVGDFNGDGRLDVAIGEGANNLVVRTGSKDAFISSKPWVEMQIPTFGDADATDLNGDGREDILLFHPATDLYNRIEVLIF